MMSIEPCDLSYDAIREYSQRVGQHHDAWDDRGKTDMSALLTKLGGSTFKGYSGRTTVVTAPKNFMVGVSVPASEQRRRFGAAHGLGHYFLHYLYPEHHGVKRFACSGSHTAEIQANVFASTLLMPTLHFSAAHAEHAGDEWKLADQFDVSPRAVEVRAQVLGLSAPADSHKMEPL